MRTPIVGVGLIAALLLPEAGQAAPPGEDPVRNDSPQAVDDDVVMNRNETQIVSVLANDFDIEGDPLTISAVSDPSHGMAMANGDGTITYTPEPGFVGTDDFTYDVEDGQGGVGSAEVSVRVLLQPGLDWTAYNDMNVVHPDVMNAENVTPHQYTGRAGHLRNLATGTVLPVQILGEVQGGFDPETNGVDAFDEGTDAAEAFNGIIDTRGTDELDDPTWRGIITFNNLNPAKVYTVTLSANRGDDLYADQRYTRVTLVGADTYSNASSAGVLVYDESSVSFSVGDNTSNGYVARWTNIRAADGTFTVVSQWDDSIGAGLYNTKGYAMGFVRLDQSTVELVACDEDADCDDGDLCTDDVCNLEQGQCSNPNNTAPCDDGIICTTEDACVDGLCEGEMSDALCDDGDPCTDNYCWAPTGCLHWLLKNVPCDDGLDCTSDDLCYNGACDGIDTCAEGEVCGIDEGVCVASESEVAYSAYNDLAWGTGQVDENITRYTSPHGGAELPSGGGMRVYSSGAEAGVSLLVTGGTFNGVGHATAGRTALAGTDAGDIFGGIVDTMGSISYINEPNSPLVLHFSGLNPFRQYRVVYQSDRADYAWTRASIVTLMGADSFRNTSSAADDNPRAFEGRLFLGPQFDSTVLPADNPNGYVARFDEIAPGADGKIVLNIEKFRTGQWRGKYGSAVLLQELALPCTVDADCDDSSPCTSETCVGGFCESADELGPCNDGIECTVNDECFGGICVGIHADNLCDDDNDCTEDLCTDDGCMFTDQTATPCDDGIGCTEDDICNRGVCEPGIPNDDLCETDGNVCTDEICQVAGCMNVDNVVPCDDGHLCTEDDVCAEGVCGGSEYCPAGTLCVLDSGDCAPMDADFMFRAYNDLGWVTDQIADNITVISAEGPLMETTGEMIDHLTGRTTGVMLTVTGGQYNLGIHGDDGRTSMPGTDAGDLFAGIVNTQGAVAYTDDPDGQLVLTFSGLNPEALYVIAYHGDRGQYGWDRASLVTLSGAVAFVNESSAADDNPAPGSGGALFSGPQDVSTRVPADNPNGYVARFTEIQPGADGVVELVVSADGNAGGRGKYANALMIAQIRTGCFNDAECEDDNVCTENSCDVWTGACMNAPTQGACDDGIACTVNDECDAGACGGTPDDAQCDDSNTCTDDACDVAVGCVTMSNVSACDDGAGCTMDDLCHDGVCGGADTCPMGEYCNVDAGQCVDAPDCAQDADCDDGDICTDNVCDPDQGVCVTFVNQAPCDDGVDCTVGDQCDNGVCVPGGASDAACDDGESCTDDVCDAETGCAYTNVAGPCSDGFDCTEGDQCNDGVCVGGAPDDALCDDANPCTDEGCELGGGCVYTDNQNPCDDGLTCTVDDQCGGGRCSGADTCPGGLSCSPDTDLCVLSDQGLAFRAYNDLGWLDDGQPSAGITLFSAPGSTLDTAGEMIDYTTGEGTGVTLTVMGGRYQPNSHGRDGRTSEAGSDAGDVFAGIVDTRGAVAYINQPDSPLVLTFTDLDPNATYLVVLHGDRRGYGWDRASLVTLEGAETFTNHSSAAVDNPAPGSGGALFSGPDDASTRLPADNPDGYVARFLDIDPGADGEFALVVSADGSAGFRGKYVNAVMLAQVAAGCQVDAECDDGNVCTDDACNVDANECAHTANQAVCDDGIACTLVDQCVGGMCQGGAPDDAICEDGNVCTDDVCNPATGCEGMPQVGPCDDGAACTENDMCAAGECHGADVCPDGLACDLDTGVCGVEARPLFRAYNDLAWVQEQLSTDITYYTSPNGGSSLPSAGELVDHHTGEGVGVLLEVSGGNFNGAAHAYDGGGDAPAGTDAGEIFGGIVSTRGAIAYLSGPDSPLELTFTGLAPSGRYTIVFHGHRGAYGWDRASSVRILGADGFINTSSAANDNPEAGSGGALFSGPDDPSTRVPADNPNGYVARFTEIDPGADGEVVLSIDVDGSAGYRGKYASAVMIEALEGGCEGDGACDDGIACTEDDHCVGGVCVPGNVNHAVCDDSNECTDDLCNPLQGCIAVDNVALCDDGIACTENDVCGGGECLGEVVCQPGSHCDFESGQCVAGPIEDWVAFNDIYIDGSISNAPNTTGYSYETVGGVLVNYETGAPLPVTMTGTVQGGYDPKRSGDNAEPGTEADATFGGVLSLLGSFELDAPHWQNVVTFENLAPNKRYAIVLTANRDAPAYTGARFTRVTIVGADAYTNASSDGVIVNGEDSVSLSTGNNRQGYVARWTEITAIDGSFSIVSEWDDTQGEGSANTKAYAMSVFKLIQLGL